MKIMLLEDDVALNKSIKKLLNIYDFEVVSFHDGEEALNAIDDSFDMYILDINVPSLDGIEVLDAIRGYQEDVPVIMISAKNEIDTIMYSYSKGCNDFIKKPFDIRELKIKIDQYAKKNSYGDVEIGEALSFNLDKDILHYEEKPIKLTKKELRMMKILVKNLGFNVTYDQIVDYVWDDEDLDISLDSIRTVISRLRQKLPKNIITSNVGLGYSIEKQ